MMVYSTCAGYKKINGLVNDKSIDNGDDMKIQQNGAVTSVWLDGLSAGWEQWLLLRSDAHHDSPHCNTKLEKRHLDLALERNALILDAGDLFDAMQGREDKRRMLSDLKEMHKRNDYFNSVIDEACSFYEPYAKNWLLLGKGNHESSVIKHNGLDLTSLLCQSFRRNGGETVIGGYGGWVVFFFLWRSNNHRTVKRLRYFHGAGGEAPVTRGTIQTNRQMVYLPDADIILNGHSHNQYTMAVKRERISTRGNQYFDLCWHVRTPGYKNDYGAGAEGWEVERGGVPKPQGAVWIRFYGYSDFRVEIR